VVWGKIQRRNSHSYFEVLCTVVCSLVFSFDFGGCMLLVFLVRAAVNISLTKMSAEVIGYSTTSKYCTVVPTVLQ